MTAKSSLHEIGVIVLPPAVAPTKRFEVPVVAKILLVTAVDAVVQPTGLNRR